MITSAEASAIIADTVASLTTETVPLAAATGRALATSVIAERDAPPFDRVMMDGAAIRWQADRRSFPITRTQFAGEPALTLSDPDSAIEIMTGAELPAGCDTVIPVERFSKTDGSPRILQLEDGYTPDQGQFIHRVASDHASGTVLLRPGARIGAAEIAVIASAGLTEIAVVAQPRVAIVATGDELVAPGAPVLAHQVRLSNGPALAAAVTLAGFPVVSWHHLRDDRAAMEHRVAELLGANDMLILSGGVSKGKADYVPEVLAALGVNQQFHRVAQKPGKPPVVRYERDRTTGIRTTG